MKNPYPHQRSTEGQRSSAEAEAFSPSATASAIEGLEGRRPKILRSQHLFLKRAYFQALWLTFVVSIL